MFTIPSEYYLKIFVNKQVLFDGLKVNMIDKHISKHPDLCTLPPPSTIFYWGKISKYLETHSEYLSLCGNDSRIDGGMREEEEIENKHLSKTISSFLLVYSQLIVSVEIRVDLLDSRVFQDTGTQEQNSKMVPYTRRGLRE